MGGGLLGIVFIGSSKAMLRLRGLPPVGYANERRVSPHRLRHSSITAFLDASGGNLRAAQALSRHRNQNTLNLYDDNRRQEQKGASGMLEDLLTENGDK